VLLGQHFSNYLVKRVSLDLGQKSRVIVCEQAEVLTSGVLQSLGVLHSLVNQKIVLLCVSLFSGLANATETEIEQL
jgi:hypothetical protein